MAVVEIPLQFMDSFPGSLQGLQPQEIRKVFPFPTLIEIEGRKKQPLFLSCLLHGNETTSFFVLQRLQEYLQDKQLPRSLILFVGNVFAAEEGVRFIEGQKDYNRVWLGKDSLEQESLEHGLAHHVLHYVQEKGELFASIDIHNNTGSNPLYACVHREEPSHIYLGSLFSKTLVYFRSPASAQSVVFSQLCPAVTLECGKSGESLGVDRAFQFLLDVMSLDSLEHSTENSGTSLFGTVGRIVLKNIVDYDFDFGGSEATLRFPENFEKLNFGVLQEGELFARYQGQESPFHVYNEKGEDIFDQYFTVLNNEVRIKQAVVPSMFTINKEVIRQDCLGYIMKPME